VDDVWERRRLVPMEQELLPQKTPDQTQPEQN
jgi:hypothetical protein